MQIKIATEAKKHTAKKLTAKKNHKVSPKEFGGSMAPGTTAIKCD